MAERQRRTTAESRRRSLGRRHRRRTRRPQSGPPRRGCRDRWPGGRERPRVRRRRSATGRSRVGAGAHACPRRGAEPGGGARRALGGCVGRELTARGGQDLAEGVGEVRRAAQILRFCAGEADRAARSYSSPRAGEQILVTRKPVGVVARHHAVQLPDRDPGVEDRAGAGLRQHRRLEAGQHRAAAGDAPRRRRSSTPGCRPVCSTCSSPAARVGDALVEHPGVDAITFTGSTAVGRRIAAPRPARGVPVQAEMGGKNAAVVLADADLDLAVDAGDARRVPVDRPEVHRHLTADRRPRASPTSSSPGSPTGPRR